MKTEEDIVEKLNKEYGPENEEWAGGVVTIKGVKKFYAVKSPSSAAVLDLRKQNEEHITKLALNKKSTISPITLEKNFVVDCLITDVEGCASVQDFRVDADVKPALVSLLKDLASGLAETGLESLKKS
jgi:hypothetical protein